MMKDRRGFTLIELLVVVVVIGILAAIAVPRYLTIRRLTYFATVKSDLRVLSIQQELYHKEHDEYAATLDALPGWAPSPGVEVTLASADAMGWAATATHPALSGEQCGIYFGTASSADAPPATSPGVPTCSP